MISRYEAAMAMKENWNVVIRKGDEHTNGIYFTNQYGYVIERTFAVRIQHDECSPAVFYIPSLEEEGEDEVVVEYPYHSLIKKNKNFHPLFCGEYLPVNELGSIFETEWMTDRGKIKAQPLIDMLLSIPNKRERDRSRLRLTITGNKIEAEVIKKEKESLLVMKRMEMIAESEDEPETDMVYITVNANTVLYILLHFTDCSIISFSNSHDRIILTNEGSTPKVEGVISMSNKWSRINRENGTAI